MASDLEVEVPRLNGIMADDLVADSLQPSTPQETGPPASSQMTLPSTEIPGSPMDLNQSFKTEINDDRPAITVIPSSLTPPPSTQVTAHNSHLKRSYSNSQQSALFSPPATILNTLRDRDIGSDYVPPAAQQVLEASTDELRTMLQTSIAEQQKLKMEAAHHKLQYNLLSLQADEDSKRAVVEHDMVRREVDALRKAEHSRQAKRELSTTSDSIQSKYLHLKMQYEAAMEENEALRRRVRVAKKVIQQKEEETISMTEEREMLLNRIRENREHFHMLCSPGGIFHGALTPKPTNLSTPQQLRATPRQASKALRRDEQDGREHGLSALLEAMSQSQDNSNNSAPTTPLVPHRAVPRQIRRHNRNAQSMSSLPTTPLNRPRGELAGLLPSVDLVAQTEPRNRHTQSQFIPTTPPAKRSRQRKSRESTISADDNEELARQALESVRAAHPRGSQASVSSRTERSRRSAGKDGEEEEEEEEVFDSQASQAAVEMLRRHPGKSFDVADSTAARETSLPPLEKSAVLHAKLLAKAKGAMDKRKFSGSTSTSTTEAPKRDQGSPVKKARGGSSQVENPKVGLGIQYGQ